MNFELALPLIFMGMMGLSMLIYVILDGYDLGVGVLLLGANADEQDTMISSIGPFWDANETWLVMGVGILLTCFPLAHGVILGNLYLPVAVMLLGLILRGVSFDFRAKVPSYQKQQWNRWFFLGSLITALAQGWMLGSYILGFQSTWAAWAFSALIAVCVLAAYTLLGAAWLILKTENTLQRKAIDWARYALWGTAVGVLAISVATPWMSERIFQKWFALPYIFLLIPIPVATLVLFAIMTLSLQRLPARLQQGNMHNEWIPLACMVGIVFLAFYGLAYSLFPYLVVDQITVWQGAASFETLRIIFWGAIVVLPTIGLYTVYSYRVFSGKAQPLAYVD